MNKHRIVIVRIKGKGGLTKQLVKTLELLRLYKKNNCVVVPNTLEFVGMLTKVKEVVTWGELDEKTCKQLLEKRGKLPGKMRLDANYLKDKCKTDFDAFTKDFMSFKKELKDIPGLKLFFKLSPPVKGFERKGVKVPYSLGGVLGYRKDKINELVLRMV
tara:strand:+ start:35989 stop:36465 length:477 start_codon:yes stop_codon:yes gene_type:complete